MASVADGMPLPVSARSDVPMLSFLFGKPSVGETPPKPAARSRRSSGLPASSRPPSGSPGAAAARAQRRVRPEAG